MSDDCGPKCGDYESLVREASVLLVGAGGIGCEVIKNLVLCGLRKLTIVDIDTIDISNLNRQFLYQKKDVSMYKAVVACERAKEAAPGCEISAKVCNVLEWKPDDVAPYDVVLNALDNIKARSHVNYCCIKANIPLIESGSSGFNGQVYPILKNITKCYECQEKPRNIAMPVCTIRQMPENAEHCIAWARKLYELLFGTPDEGNVLNDLNIPQLPISGMSTEVDAYYWVKRAFNYLFNQQIMELIEMKEKWPNDKPPSCIEYPLEEEPLSSDEGDCDRPNKVRKVTGETEKGGEQQYVSIKEKMKIHNVKELATHFRDSAVHVITQKAQLIGTITFDKDDPLCIKFVAAASNLRMLNFNIPQVNTWDVQSIAGSIIPAIAATNAIVAATQVMQLMHLLNAKKKCTSNLTKEAFEKSACKFVWVKGTVTGSMPLVKGALCSPEDLEGPNPKCVICQQRYFRLQLHDLEEWTLQKIVDRVCKVSMGLQVVNIDFDNRNVYDSEFAEDDESYAEKAEQNALPTYGIDDGSILTITCLDTGKQADVQLSVEDSIAAGEFSFLTH
ncbi:SUMO-activating enzyme subunit Uba2 [Babesia gibsoni]|uniref:SUMO-activating enzyme subunit n=1 Tax=Babesia gibsoni TaxID=33632 RepID=A0AAD8PD33_BABGI|nr:SUMO-activating enzyme subunit Uba2 [Babesia gibsoni]